jgi:hypothetical protein
MLQLCISYKSEFLSAILGVPLPLACMHARSTVFVQAAESYVYAGFGQLYVARAICSARKAVLSVFRFWYFALLLSWSSVTIAPNYCQTSHEYK